jgi:inosose dehydratase
MSNQNSRRDFLVRMAACAAAASTTGLPAWAMAPQVSPMKFGYTAMTWNKDEHGAIDDIAALGYEGIQFRIDAVTEFKPDELKALLAQKKLTFVALSSGELNIDPAVEADQLALHTSNAKFVQQTGGLYLQVLDQLKLYPRKVSPEECTRLGKLLTELGRRTADLGVKLGYHNHMNTISEKPDDLQRVLDASDPRYVHLELDTAHYLAGGGDPAKAIAKYHNNIVFLHLKDVIDIPLGSENSKYPFKFVELGKGRVDIPAVFAALRQNNFNGWCVIELDRVPDKTRTPKECAAISKAYLEKTIGVQI